MQKVMMWNLYKKNFSLDEQKTLLKTQSKRGFISLHYATRNEDTMTFNFFRCLYLQMFDKIDVKNLFFCDHLYQKWYNEFVYRENEDTLQEVWLFLRYLFLNDEKTLLKLLQTTTDRHEKSIISQATEDPKLCLFAESLINFWSEFDN